MSDRPATPSLTARTPSLSKQIFIAGLLLLCSACAGEGPVSPTVAVDPAALTTVSMARTASARGPAECVPNARLIGRIALSTADVPGTWWHLTREGLDALGVTDYVAQMEVWFGREFSSEAEAISFLVAQVEAVDTNRNGYVCAYTLRGTRTSLGEPEYALTIFQTRDDKHAEN